MARKLFHAFVNPVGDLSGFTGTKPSDWNSALEYANAANSAPSGTDAQIRELLVADRQYFVRTDGSDSNTGLANTSGAAFLTIQHAVDVIVQTLDPGGFSITIQIADGTYNESIAVGGVANGVLSIVGNSASPSNVIISSPDANPCFWIQSTNCYLFLEGFKLISSAGHCILCDTSPGIVELGKVVFGAANNNHLWIFGCKQFYAFTDYEIAGNATSHIAMSSAGNATISISGVVTFTGTPVFSDSFVNSTGLTYLEVLVGSFSGTFTGKRYTAGQNSIVNTFGSGTTYFPGTVAGSTDTGGQYL